MTAVAWVLAKALSLIFLVALIGGYLVRRKIISQKDIDSLSHVTVVVLLPCLMFSKIIRYFKPEEFPLWWILPLVALAMIGIGIGLSFLFYARNWRANQHNIALSAIMNANYMVLPIGKLVFADQFDQFAAYCFLFVLGVNPILWSIGKYLATDGKDKKLNWRNFITPPLVGTILALIFVLTRLNRFIPELVLKPIEFIGDAAIPVVTLVLGATIGSISLRKLPNFTDILRVLGIKLFILPAITIFILVKLNLYSTSPLVADLLVIEAAVAPASQFVIQVRKYGGHVQEVGSMMFLNYVACMVTIPLWFMIWRACV
jgi:malate permease and related proteins